MRRAFALALAGAAAFAGGTAGPASARPGVNSGSAYYYPQVPSRPFGPSGRPQPVISGRVHGVPPSFGPRRVYGTPPQFGATYGAPPSNRVWGNPANDICRTCRPGERFPGIPYYGR